MNTKDIQAIENVWAAMRPTLRDELLQLIDQRIESFRRAVYISDEWCCVEMRRAAVDLWGAATPRTSNSYGSVVYQLRGHHVNYCPFCGVAFARPKART
jgi:hypothetical protein